MTILDNIMLIIVSVTFIIGLGGFIYVTFFKKE